MSHEHFVMLHKPEDTSRISRKTINFEWFIQHSYQIVLTNDNLVIVSIHSDHVENRLVQSIIAASSIGQVVLENAATAFVQQIIWHKRKDYRAIHCNIKTFHPIFKRYQ